MSETNKLPSKLQKCRNEPNPDFGHSRAPPCAPACNNEPKLLSLGMHEQEVPSATRDSGGTRYSDTDTG